MTEHSNKFRRNLAITASIALCLTTIVFLVPKSCIKESSLNATDSSLEIATGELSSKMLCEAKPRGDLSTVGSILKQKRYELTRYGAVGSAVLHVNDINGNPVQDADVHLYFTQPTENDPTGTVRGNTDSQGVFAATRRTNFACKWKVSKEGYHSSQGCIMFSPYFSEYSATTGKWTEKPLEATVILKRKSSAKILRGKRIFHDLKFPTNTWVGFDFLECDSVAPYGQGRTAHIEFWAESCGHTAIGDYGITNTLILRTPCGGVAVFEEDKETFSPFMPVAPSDFNATSLCFTYARTRNTILKNETLGRNKYIVFKTTVDRMPTGEDGCHYGIIRRLDYLPGHLQFEYFFNTEPDDRRIDGDIKHGWDLGM